MIKKAITNFGARIGDRVYVLSYRVYSNKNNHVFLDLDLLAGIDYINPDMSDQQGWCPPSNFIEDVRWDSLIHYIEDESIKETLIDSDYEIVNKSDMDNIIFFLAKNQM